MVMSVLVVTLGCGRASAAQPRVKAPVVVELFTSQGCSSCPPADALIIRLAAEDPNVIPLSFHVDYWNRLGWADPFSSSAWSQRQQNYASRLGSGVYTPQAVINGSAEAVGSDESKARRVIAAAGATAGQALIKLSMAAGKVAADVSVTDAIAAPKLQLIFVTWQRSVTTAVRRGENGGRSLKNDFIVRKLTVADEFTGASGKHHAETQVQIDPAWEKGPFGIVAFLQDPKSLKIYAAATIAL